MPPVFAALGSVVASGVFVERVTRRERAGVRIAWSENKEAYVVDGWQYDTSDRRFNEGEMKLGQPNSNLRTGVLINLGCCTAMFRRKRDLRK